MTPQLFDIPAEPILTNGKIIGWEWEHDLLKVEIGECAGTWEAFVFVSTRADWIFTAQADAWQFVIPQVTDFLTRLAASVNELRHPPLPFPRTKPEDCRE